MAEAVKDFFQTVKAMSREVDCLGNGVNFPAKEDFAGGPVAVALLEFLDGNGFFVGPFRERV